MRFRKLRIAWSVVWGLAAVLLIVLWVRSYQTMNQLRYVNGGRLATQVASYQGRAYYYRGPTFLSPERQWVFASEPINVATGNPHPPLALSPVPASQHFSVPYFVLIGILFAVIVLAWTDWRFSLRTLLIVTTLVAVVLGLTVWAVR